MNEKNRNMEVTREAARALEEDFFHRLKSKLQALTEIFNPLDGKEYPVDHSILPMQKDERDRVKRLMVESRILDRNVRKQMPVNRAIRMDVGAKGLFSGFTPEVCVVGLVLNPLEELAAKGVSSSPVTFTELDDAVKRASDRTKVFHYIGVLSPTGFSDECMDNLPRSKHLVTVLVERGDEGVWFTRADEGLPWPGAAAFFDLETVPEKLDRCKRAILGHPDMRLKGGHLQLGEIRKEMGFPEDLADRAINEIVKDSGEFQVKDIDGQKILQRSRF